MYINIYIRVRIRLYAFLSYATRSDRMPYIFMRHKLYVDTVVGTSKDNPVHKQ